MTGRRVAWHHASISSEVSPDVSALAINVTIPEGLRWTDTRRSEESTLSTLNVRLLPDGRLAAKGLRPTDRRRPRHVRLVPRARQARADVPGRRSSIITWYRCGSSEATRPAPRPRDQRSSLTSATTSADGVRASTVQPAARDRTSSASCRPASYRTTSTSAEPGAVIGVHIGLLLQGRRSRRTRVSARRITAEVRTKVAGYPIEVMSSPAPSAPAAMPRS
jgi:hypothetical protein